MEIILGLSVIVLGAFFQSSFYVPIKRVKSWSWESFWLIQGIFAWIAFHLLGALLAVPAGSGLTDMFINAPSSNLLLSMLFGMLWGIGGLTFGLSMRYLGVALGQSIALGTCAVFGTISGPLLIRAFLPDNAPSLMLAPSVIAGIVATVAGIAVIGYAGALKAKECPSDQDSSNGFEFNFPKGIIIALIAGAMSGCFNVGLEFGSCIAFDSTPSIYRMLPATLLVTVGGFVTNAAYCLWQNHKNGTFADYKKWHLYPNNLLFCALAGLLWYSQFFGLSLGRGFLGNYPSLIAFSWCILMALNVIFSNAWGVALNEWNGVSRRTISILVSGIAILIISTFLPQIL